jgi:hypothetical protein
VPTTVTRLISVMDGPIQDDRGSDPDDGSAANRVTATPIA